MLIGLRRARLGFVFNLTARQVAAEGSSLSENAICSCPDAFAAKSNQPSRVRTRRGTPLFDLEQVPADDHVAAESGLSRIAPHLRGHFWIVRRDEM